MDQAKEMAKIAFEALEDKKGEDVCAIDISAVSVLADYFVIANGNSDSQVRALVENVEEKMHKAGYAAKETEGHRSGAWVLIDFGDVIVHIFDRENRQFYNLEITDDNWFQCIVFRLEAEDAFFFVKSFDSSAVIE